jgi:hypothetical protein
MSRILNASFSCLSSFMLLMKRERNSSTNLHEEQQAGNMERLNFVLASTVLTGTVEAKAKLIKKRAI